MKSDENGNPASESAQQSRKSPARKPRASSVKKPDSEPEQNIVSHASQHNDNFQEILDALPPKKREAFIEIIAASESHSGWLPTPDYLRKYDAILPGLAERIVALPEREQAHRHRVVEKLVDNDNSLKRRGQTFAMISTILFLALSVLLIYVDQYAWASRVAIFGLVAVVGIFVTGKWADAHASKSDTDNEEKEEV